MGLSSKWMAAFKLCILKRFPIITNLLLYVCSYNKLSKRQLNKYMDNRGDNVMLSLVN